MPCNSIAVTLLAIAVATVEKLLESPDILRALQANLPQIVGVGVPAEQVVPAVYGTEANRVVVFTINHGRLFLSLRIDRNGMSLEGDWTAAQRTAIERLVEKLMIDLSEQEIVDAIAAQLPMAFDEPIYNEQRIKVGRQLTIRM